ncbi:spermatogenesis-associated protein 16-like [Toxotes jaculatrix]|uniref:spermatogenesis-associated protein 16-like n=1 Tax=Toxotes jaculatrix TaxID=941984 RepID=UPI001B3B186B|nr:spermatogenesis-associated protein 16-like [Toxotes jaculatrix]
MRCNKRAAVPEPDQTPKSCRASLSTPPAESTGREVKRLKRRIDIGQERRDVNKEEKKDIKHDKGEKQTDCIPRRSNQWISVRRLQKVENSLAFGMEMLRDFNKPSPSFSSSSYLQASIPSHTVPPYSFLSGIQAHKARESGHGPNLSFLPPIDKRLFVLLRDANMYCSKKTYKAAITSLCTALQLSSEGHVLKDTHCADPEDINLVFSYIQARLVVCYLKMRKPQLALIHAHRSIQLNPSHFQNHLRQAAVYRMLGKPCQAAKSVLTADWLYCLLGGTERHISKQLKLYWQAMLCKARLTEKDISVIYTPYSGGPTAKDISQAAEACMKQHPGFTDFIYTDPRGGHILPQTTDWLSASAVPQNYLITLGFRRREDGLFLKKIYSRIWPFLPDIREEGVLLRPQQQQKQEVESQKLCDMYKTILPILDLMQATQINSGVCVGSGLIEWLQYGSLLLKLGYHREHSTIMHRCQAQLATAPYLPQINTQQENTLVCQLEDRIHSVERTYFCKKVQLHQCRQVNKGKLLDAVQPIKQLRQLCAWCSGCLTMESPRDSRTHRGGFQETTSQMRGN